MIFRSDWLVLHPLFISFRRLHSRHHRWVSEMSCRIVVFARSWQGHPNKIHDVHRTIESHAPGPQDVIQLESSKKNSTRFLCEQNLRMSSSPLCTKAKPWASFTPIFPCLQKLGTVGYARFICRRRIKLWLELIESIRLCLLLPYHG